MLGKGLKGGQNRKSYPKKNLKRRLRKSRKGKKTKVGQTPSRLKPILTKKALTIAVVTPQTAEHSEETTSPEERSDSSEDSVKTVIDQSLGEDLFDTEVSSGSNKSSSKL